MELEMLLTCETIHEWDGVGVEAVIILEEGREYGRALTFAMMEMLLTRCATALPQGIRHPDAITTILE